MQAVILVGGEGTRLGKLIKKKPKSMIKIGEKPILQHQIELLAKYGIHDIIIITYYLSEIIEEYFKEGIKLGVNITYFKEYNPLGTTGGIKEIEEKLIEDFIVIYGDIMINMDLQKLINFHKSKKGICTLVLHPNDHPYDSDLVEMDNNQKIVAFHSKPHPKNKYFKNLVNAGVYVLSPKILKYINKGVKSDFGKDVFPKVITKENIYGYNTAEYLKDMGTPKRLKQVNKNFNEGKIDKLNKEHKRKCIFIDRDGVINEEVNLLHKIKDFKLIPGVGNAIKKINNSNFLVIIVTNQPVIARNLCSIKELEEIHKKMDTLLGKENAKIDEIYYCPHHPDKGYPEENHIYKIKCKCRKPNTGMIDTAVKDFNIDLNGSFIIGDSYRDIECGRKKKITTIAVGAGSKNKNMGQNYSFKNLSNAVDFIFKKKKC